MSVKDKLIQRLQTNPKDFTFDELQRLLKRLGFEMSTKGKTSGSRVQFLRDNIPIMLHKPHQKKELLDYQIKQVIDVLKKEGLI
ncbi:MAG: type II toxin-antitoxin system HicA family toxin [Oscillospiraceae bacterium]|jgi:hypothetical protein|nr:type II toxin-antitoxin system HicA family toxin [Oscillospiraceae bacterium]